MVSMKAYSHLTLQEREFIYVQTHQGESSRAPARKLGRDHATVVRELKRNSKPDPDAKTLIYSPSVAEQLAGQRRHHRKKRLDDPSVRTFVIQKLTQGWSPEQISGRLKLKAPAAVVVPSSPLRPSR